MGGISLVVDECEGDGLMIGKSHEVLRFLQPLKTDTSQK